jgi:hypothetical protein
MTAHLRRLSWTFGSMQNVVQGEENAFPSSLGKTKVVSTGRMTFTV